MIPNYVKIVRAVLEIVYIYIYIYTILARLIISGDYYYYYYDIFSNYLKNAEQILLKHQSAKNHFVSFFASDYPSTKIIKAIRDN